MTSTGAMAKRKAPMRPPPAHERTSPRLTTVNMGRVRPSPWTKSVSRTAAGRPGSSHVSTQAPARRNWQSKPTMFGATGTSTVVPFAARLQSAVNALFPDLVASRIQRRWRSAHAE